MAKIKGKKTGPKPKEHKRTAITTIKSVPEWKEWLEITARGERLSVADLVEEALEKWATELGKMVPPER